MHSDLFDTTIPFGEPELMSASSYRRYLDEADTAQRKGRNSGIASLSPSLQADLGRFEQESGSTEAVEVLAACVRHAKRLTIHLQYGNRVVPVTVFPQEKIVHCPMPMCELTARSLAELRVMNVEPAMLTPPIDIERALTEDDHIYHPLAPLLWEIAMRGQRRELLPEIVGPAVYRVAPGLDLGALPASGLLKAAIVRLRGLASNLNEIAGWPGLDRERAARLLNALYLQAGLIISRSHPDAVR